MLSKQVSPTNLFQWLSLENQSPQLFQLIPVFLIQQADLTTQPLCTILLDIEYKICPIHTGANFASSLSCCKSTRFKTSLSRVITSSVTPSLPSSCSACMARNTRSSFTAITLGVVCLNLIEPLGPILKFLGWPFVR